MCGIIGFTGNLQAPGILVDGLQQLEYRGYDSAGVALISNNQQLNVYKTKGKVSDLENFVTQKDISGNIGIAHTHIPCIKIQSFQEDLLAELDGQRDHFDPQCLTLLRLKIAGAVYNNFYAHNLYPRSSFGWFTVLPGFQ